MRFTVDIFDLVVSGRFGPLSRGATQAAVYAALGEPDARNNPGALPEDVSIWLYGNRPCRGHLEFHFLKDKLWMIFADYLPLRRYLSPRFRFEPGCLGGLVLPSVAEVRLALKKSDAEEPRFELLDPRFFDPPPPPEAPRIPTRGFNKAVRKSGGKVAGSAFYGQLIWPSGTTLGVGYHYAQTRDDDGGGGGDGERLLSEDIVQVLTVPMMLE